MQLDAASEQIVRKLLLKCCFYAFLDGKITQLERKEGTYESLPRISFAHQVRSLSCGKDHTVV